MTIYSKNTQVYVSLHIVTICLYISLLCIKTKRFDTYYYTSQNATQITYFYTTDSGYDTLILLTYRRIVFVWSYRRIQRQRFSRISLVNRVLDSAVLGVIRKIKE